MIDWLLSEQGSALSTWVSNIIGVFAIVIAVRAYVNDRNRAAEEAMRERCRHGQAVVDFLEQAIRSCGIDRPNHPTNYVCIGQSRYDLNDQDDLDKLSKEEADWGPDAIHKAMHQC